ncbi:hypothetical protein FC38_GL000324 [Lactobacillus gigeriorum DSM 23908 = CRBIP 24.85]|uniref:DUF2785 domain-containing protein n=2 Tax=Lactobacillus gigeriorum DSM 23908 = CRBIP 24.85 TaxID=1423751 RepID=A0ABR5PVC1_9LACO|nr:hypothetical protein FC38_GL000324 [Lactobacillus gigeriorum DSM 23908 = CRBIP 24.85]
MEGEAMKEQLYTLVNQTDISQITDEQLSYMLANLGNPDPILRDEIIFTLFARAFDEEVFTSEQKQAIVEYLLANNCLYEGLGKTSDLTLMRSFTALVLSLAIDNDAKTTFLTDSLRKELLKAGQAYVFLENDWRSYDPDKGYIHALAHGSDLLASCLAHPSCQYDQQLLTKLQNFVIKIDRPLYESEAKRLARAVKKLLTRYPDQAEILTAFETIDVACWKKLESSNGQYYYLDFWQEFLSSLYFLSDQQRVKEFCQNKANDYFTKLGYRD